MKVLVAAKLCLGERDYCNALDGELLRTPKICGEGLHDHGCSCRRTLQGIRTGGRTTVFRVEDLNLSRQVYALKLRKSWKRSELLEMVDMDRVKQFLEDERELLLLAASQFPAGSLLCRQDREFILKEKPNNHEANGLEGVDFQSRVPCTERTEKHWRE